MTSVDVCIVGAGPIGIECAIALKRLGASYVHLERGNLAATIEWYAPGTTFFSSSDRIALAGVPLYTANQGKATREDYLLYLRGLVTQFELDIEFHAEVTDVTRSDSEWTIEYQKGGRTRGVTAKNIILAVGDMHKPRLLGVPGENLPHVNHYLEEPHSYFGQRVLIVGGKNSAVEAAIRLERVGALVTVSYRGKTFDDKRVKYWLYPELQYLMRSDMLKVLFESEVVSIGAEEVTLRMKKSKEEKNLVFDRVLLLTGYEQEKTLFVRAGLTLEGEGEKPKLNPDTYESDVPGIYVIGTAVAGTQTGGVKEFIETSHEHIVKVVRAIAGREIGDFRKPDYSFLEN
ncbi:MAG: NAD(P)-binding domain-containing protein [Bdellovibrionales bacterium]|nr:NAD(P)-binding domain-containing protein [Bdellovibrionales bacterium]